MSDKLNIQDKSFFKKLDGNFTFVILALNVIGLINLYSATHGVHLTSSTRLFTQQIVWLLGGWTVYFVVTFMNYHFFQRIAYLLYWINVGALALVMFKGKSFYGAQRWLDLGFFHYQPSETMKLMTILVLAKILSKKTSSEGLGLSDLALPAVFVAIPFALTVKQPDLGTAMLIAMISFAMLFFVRIKKSILILCTLAAVVATPLVWSFGLKPYQKGRILTFLTPGRDPRGAGYNSIQSKIAVGSGRVLGKGFRKGTQSQLEFLPERHTDFIFSVLSEEHGFIGSATTIGLFLILYLMGVRIASQAKDRFAALVVIGVLSLLFFHVFINIGMVIGILPIVGVPLPLLSYGGTSMLTTMAGLGLISSIAYRRYLF